MEENQIQQEPENKLNVHKFFETFAEILGRKYGVEVEVKEVRKKTPEELKTMPNRMFIHENGLKNTKLQSNTEKTTKKNKEELAC